MRFWEWYFNDSDATGDPIEIEYQFDCGDREVTYYRDGSGYPGSEPSVNIVSFTFKGVDITDLIHTLVASNVIDDLEMEITEYEKDGGGWDIEDFFE